MTIEEISKAKREAEARISEELRQLQEKTGMNLARVDVRFIEVTTTSDFRRRIAADVSIELNVP